NLRYRRRRRRWRPPAAGPPHKQRETGRAGEVQRLLPRGQVVQGVERPTLEPQGHVAAEEDPVPDAAMDVVTPQVRRTSPPTRARVAAEHEEDVVLTPGVDDEAGATP